MTSQSVMTCALVVRVKTEKGEMMDVKARLAQSVERLTLNQVVVGSSPTVGDPFIFSRSI